MIWEKVDGEDSCMKDQLCLCSLCKWGGFALRAWGFCIEKMGAVLPHFCQAATHVVNIFSCRSSAWAGMVWVNVLMWLWKYIYISVYLYFLWKYIYTHMCVCGYICWWNFRWADGLCHRWEQKHSCQPLFGRRDTADLCCTMSFTEFNFSTARTVICKSALPVAA